MLDITSAGIEQLFDLLFSTLIDFQKSLEFLGFQVEKKSLFAGP